MILRGGRAGREARLSPSMPCGQPTPAAPASSTEKTVLCPQWLKMRCAREAVLWGPGRRCLSSWLLPRPPERVIDRRSRGVPSRGVRLPAPESRDTDRRGGFKVLSTCLLRPAHDVHGNVAERTLPQYRPYSYDEHDGRSDPASEERREVRGGSFYDRPKPCSSA